MAGLLDSMARDIEAALTNLQGAKDKAETLWDYADKAKMRPQADELNTIVLTLGISMGETSAAWNRVRRTKKEQQP